MPATLADTIRVADSYALVDPTQPASHEPVSSQQVNDNAGPSRRPERQDSRLQRDFTQEQATASAWRASQETWQGQVDQRFMTIGSEVHQLYQQYFPQPGDQQE